MNYNVFAHSDEGTCQQVQHRLTDGLLIIFGSFCPMKEETQPAAGEEEEEASSPQYNTKHDGGR